MHSSSEKRAQARLHGSFPVFLRFDRGYGEQVEAHTLADNISQGGLYLQLPYALDKGTKLFALIAMPSGAKLATYGHVLRVEQKNQSLFGMAICFHRSRLFAG